MALRAVLLDVGGTLWPDHFSHPDLDSSICQRLEGLLPDLDPVQTLRVLREALKADHASVEQATEDCLARVLGGREGIAPADIRRALCVPAAEVGLRLFPDATQLLADSAALGLTTVVLSNVQVRGAMEYWRDFADLGIAEYIHAVVTSLEVGYRKPHPAMFETALRAANCCDPSEAVMIGDSEVKDIEPALALGMRTIRVAIESPKPERSAAHALVDTLREAATILRHWAPPQAERTS